MSGKLSVLCYTDCRRVLPFAPSSIRGGRFARGSRVAAPRAYASSEASAHLSAFNELHANGPDQDVNNRPRPTPAEEIVAESKPNSLSSLSRTPFSPNAGLVNCPVLPGNLVATCPCDGRILHRSSSPVVASVCTNGPLEETIACGSSVAETVLYQNLHSKEPSSRRNGSDASAAERSVSPTPVHQKHFLARLSSAQSPSRTQSLSNALRSIRKGGGVESMPSPPPGRRSSSSGRRRPGGDLIFCNRRSSSATREESRCRALEGVYRAAVGPAFSIVGYYPSETRLLLAEADRPHFRIRSGHLYVQGVAVDNSNTTCSESSNPSGALGSGNLSCLRSNASGGVHGTVPIANPESSNPASTNGNPAGTSVGNSMKDANTRSGSNSSSRNQGKASQDYRNCHERVAAECNTCGIRSNSNSSDLCRSASDDTDAVRDSANGRLLLSGSPSLPTTSYGEAILESSARNRLMRQLLVRRRRPPCSSLVLGRKWQGSFCSVAGRKHQYSDERNEDAGELTTYILWPRRQFETAGFNHGEAHGTPAGLTQEPGFHRIRGSQRGYQPAGNMKARWEVDSTDPWHDSRAECPPASKSPAEVSEPTALRSLRSSEGGSPHTQWPAGRPTFSGRENEQSVRHLHSDSRATDDEHCGWSAVCHGGSGANRTVTTTQGGSGPAAGVAIRLACVFDGHGPPSRDSTQPSLGRVVAQKAHRTFCAILEPYLEAIAKAPVLHPTDVAFATNSRQTLVAGTMRRLGEVMSNGLDAEIVCRAGCTATVVLAFDELPRGGVRSSGGDASDGGSASRVSILTANLGDSRAVAFSFIACKCYSPLPDAHSLESSNNLRKTYAVACTAVRRLTQEQNVTELPQRRRVIERLLRRANFVFALSAFAGSTRDGASKIAAAWRARILANDLSGPACYSAASSTAAALATERCELGFLPRNAIQGRIDDERGGSTLQVLADCSDMESYSSVVRQMVLARNFTAESAGSVFTVQEKYIGILRIDVEPPSEGSAQPPVGQSRAAEGPPQQQISSVLLPQSVSSQAGLPAATEGYLAPPIGALTPGAPIFASRIQLTGSIGDSLLEPVKKASCKAEDVTTVQLEVPSSRPVNQDHCDNGSSRDDYHDELVSHPPSDEQQVFTIVVTASDGLWYAMDQRFKSEACFGEHFAHLLTERWGSLQEDIREQRNSPLLASVLTNWASDKTTDDVTVAVMNFQGLRIANKVQWRQGVETGSVTCHDRASRC